MKAEDALTDLESSARAAADAATGEAGTPAMRLAMRSEFYAKYGFGTPILPRGYGEAELAFVRWQVERGLFAPVGGTPAGEPGGSPWWRAVNAVVVYDAELARRVYESNGSDLAVGDAVRAWVGYIARPSPESWLNAHNKSLINAYLENRAAAFVESPSERILMNEVLYRFLYVEALAIAWRDGALDPEIVEPRLWTLDLVTRTIALLPTRYPLIAGETRTLDHVGKTAEGGLTKVLDDDLPLPQLGALSALVAGVVKEPELDHGIKNGLPIYPELTPEVRAQLLARHAYVLRAMESP